MPCHVNSVTRWVPSTARFLYIATLLGLSGYPIDLVTGQSSAGKGRAQGYQPDHPPSAKIVVKINMMQETMTRSTTTSEHVSVFT